MEQQKAMQWLVRILFVVTGFFCYTPSLVAQSSKIDSLKSQLSEARVDTLKVQVLNKLAYEFRSNNTDSTLYYASRAYELSTAIDYIRGKGRSLSSIAIGYHVKGRFDTAALLYESAIPLVESVNDQRQLSSLYNNLGLIRRGWGDYIKAIELFQKSLSMDEALGDESGQASVLNNIGLIYAGLKEYNLALENYRRSLAFLSKRNDKLRMGQLLNNIGAVMSDMEQPDSALVNYKAALSYIPEGNCYAANPLVGIARVFGVKDQHDSVIYYSNQAIAASSKCGMSQLGNTAKTLIGEAYVYKGDYGKAKNILDDALAVARANNLLENESVIHNSFYLMYARMGDFREALGRLDAHHNASQKLLTQDKVKELARLEAQYEADKEKQQLMAEEERKRLVLEADQEAARSAQKWTVIVAVILGVFLLVVTWGLWQRRRSAIKLASLNDDLNHANDQLKQHDQYRTRMFANINHDLRSPLTLIKGYVDRVSANGTNYLSKESEQDLAHLRENADILSNMTGQIQNLISLDEGKLDVQWNEISVVSTIASVQKMYDSMSEAQGKSVELITDSEEFVIHADLGYFRKILYNLISNAFRYTAAGAYIRIHVRNTRSHAEIKIEDTGQGIAPKYLPYIFDRFYQVPGKDYKSVEGFGIGLALVKELIGLHGGSINVESELDKGTTFTFMLPHNLDKATTTPQEEVVAILPAQASIVKNSFSKPSASDKKHKLLVVDDHDEIRHYIVSTLSHSYDVKQAIHGKQALEILENEKIDLIITDLMMPWLDGFELIDQVQKNEKWQHIPVMVVSARTTEEDKLKVLDAGVNDFIAKPFDLVELTKKVENHINALDKARKNTWQAVAENKDIRSNLEQNILKKINQLIIDRIEDPSLKVEDIAELICASQRKTFDLLKSLTGQSPKSYIKNVRLEYVHNLIVSEKIHTATEAARAIGMKNGTEFKKQYLSKFGVSPFANSIGR